MDTVDEQHNFKKNFECIYYPAIVQNDDRAIQSLGGLHQISEVCIIVLKKSQAFFSFLTD